MSPQETYLVASAVGGAIGYTADVIAVKRAQKDVEPMYYSAVDEAVKSAKPEKSKRDFLTRAASSVAIRSALTLSIAAFSGIEAYSLTSPEVPSATPNTELVIDDSGSVAPVLSQEQKLVAQFNDSNPEAVIGNIGLISIRHAKDFTNYSNNLAGLPAGDAPLYNQTTLALNKVNQNASKKHTSTSGEVVVITNGNSLGDTKSLTTQANAQHTKVYVVNVERSGTNSSVIRDLNNLATSTHGKFWNANASNLGDVAKSVKANTTHQKEHTDSTPKWPYQLSGIFSLIVGANIFRSRRKLLTGKKPKGE